MTGRRRDACTVSVVVPVFNPGREIEPCIASLGRQSLSPSEHEVIFVDDGSTDGTAERLDALAAASPNTRVIHIPPSGAPGRPRNVGLDAARGRYVYFVDADDEIAPRALERLTAAADRYRSDVVLGKYASASLPRGQGLFSRDRGRMTLESNLGLLDSSLAANKLFRVEFLRGADIRFPEGWHLMEDQYVVLRAYFRARRISVLADQTYYYFRRREDGEHLSSRLLDPETDIDHLRSILDMVESETPPGPTRSRVLRRLYRAEILGRLAGEAYAELEPAYRHDLFVAASRVANERIDPAVDDELNAMVRLRSALLRRGSEVELLELARRTAAVQLSVRVRRAWWHHGQMRIVFQAHLEDARSGRPVTVSALRGRMVLDPRLTRGLIREEVHMEEELAAVRGNVLVRERDTAAEWVIPTRLSLALGGPRPGMEPHVRVPTVHGEAFVDPRRVGPSELPLDPGRWALRLRLSLLGIDQRTTISLEPGVPAPSPAVIGDPPLVVVPTTDEGFGLHVGRPGADARTGVSRDAPDRPSGASVTVALPIASDVGLRPLPAELLVRRASGLERWPAEARHRLGRLVLRWRPRSTAPGTVQLSARVAGLDDEVQIGRGRAMATGRIHLDAGAAGAKPTAMEASRWLASRTLDVGRHSYERGFRRAMPLARRVYEAMPRRLRSPLLSATRFLRR